MSIHTIIKWLESSQEYKSGIELLNKYCDNDFLKKILSKGETPFNRKKLTDELIRIEGASKKGSSYKVALNKDYNSLPDDVRELKMKTDAAFKEMRDLHSRLLFIKETERGEAAFRILELETVCQYGWTRLQKYRLTGKLPKEEVAKVKTKKNSPEELLRRKLTVRTYISRGLLQYQNELDELERRLAVDKGA